MPLSQLKQFLLNGAPTRVPNSPTRYTSMSDATRQYPTVCVVCEKAKGYPHQARTLSDKPGHLEVRLRCRDCGHEWVQIIVNNE